MEEFIINRSLAQPVTYFNDKVCVIVIQTRNNPAWQTTFIGSVQNQTYNNLELIRVQNYDYKKTIGQCWNEAIKKTKAKFVYFLGDDDFISNDLIATSVAKWQFDYSVFKFKHVAVQTCVTTVDETNTILALRAAPPTGLWLRKYLLKNPFDENLKKQVDTEMINRTKKAGESICVLGHHFGYFYRQHDNMVSGKISGVKTTVNKAE